MVIVCALSTSLFNKRVRKVGMGEVKQKQWHPFNECENAFDRSVAMILQFGFISL